MTLFSIAAIVAALINGVLTLFVLITNSRSTLNRMYAFWGGSVTLWNISAAVVYTEGTTAEQAHFWLRLLQGTVIFLPLTLAHLCRLVLDGAAPRWLRWFYLLHIGLALTLPGSHFMAGVQKMPAGWWAVGGPLFGVFMASYALLTVPLLVTMPRRAAQSAAVQKKRIWAMWSSIATLWLLGSNDIMPILGLHTYPGTEVSFIPLGNIGAIFYGVVIAYSVLQHQLLDIHLALSRLAASLARLAFVSLLGFLILLMASLAVPGSFNTYEFSIALAAIVGSIALAGALFPKLLGGNAERIERRLLGDRFELPDKVRAFIEQMRWQNDANTVLEQAERLLTGDFRLRTFAALMLDPLRRTFICTRAQPSPQGVPTFELRSDSATIQFFLDRNSRILAIHPDYQRPNEHPVARAARDELRPFGADFAFAMIHDGEAIGLLLLGGRKLTASDLTLLTQLTENLALILSQISLKDQLLLSRELDLLGRMSRGMAHDLNNLTTPLSTLIQLIDENEPIEFIRNELAPVARRSLNAMCCYIKEALFFSENLRPDFQEARLDALLESVITLSRENPRKGKNIHYVLSAARDVVVEMDHVMIQRLVMNLIANAIDASQDGGQIRIELIRLIKTDTMRDWLRVRVMDYGSGIAEQDLDRVFQPYFSTKRTGDEMRGFGLGLAICRKIATLHGGSLSIQSQVGVGTTVNLDLPSRQKPLLPPPQVSVPHEQAVGVAAGDIP